MRETGADLARSSVERPALRAVPRLNVGREGAANLLVYGENLTALHILESRYRGGVRCIYVDPPYNNQEKYAHYRDAASHETWLAQVTERLWAMRGLLAPAGSVWISIDDREMHYLKIAADGVFGRENFVCTVVWQQRTTRENRKVFSCNHEYLLVYARDKRVFGRQRNPLDTTESVLARYRNPDNDARGPWQSVSANVQAGHGTAAQFYDLVAPSGRVHKLPAGRCWIYTRARMREEIARRNIYFGKNGRGVPRKKLFLADAKPGLTPETLWSAKDVGTSDEAKKHLIAMLPDCAVFETPKPEALIQRILHIASDPGDLVLDPYLGSGTTAAVACKMKRKFIGIESGEQMLTHARKRLGLVVKGEQGGVSSQMGWGGGGGAKFFVLA